jgi:DNA repair protein RAD7
MTDDVLSYYTEKLMQLESLHIRGAFLVTRQAYIDAFAAAGHRLRSLTLSSTARTNQDVIKAIVKHCPNLEYLDVSSLARFDDDCLRLLGGCQHLKGLNVSFAGEKITDDALVEVLDVIGSGLKELNVAGNPLLGPATTAAIHACCSHLRVLDLSECQLLTDSDIVNLFTNWSRNSGLQELHLARLIEMQNSGLIAAVTHSGQTLRVLDINSCLAVNKRGLMTALDQCKKLKKFDVAFVREVDDEVVEKMQDVGIQGLAVWGCTRVTACCKVGAGVTLAGLEADIVA